MLHAKETGISSDRLGLWVMCAFIAFTLVLRRPLLRCTVVRVRVLQLFNVFLIFCIMLFGDCTRPHHQETEI